MSEVSDVTVQCQRQFRGPLPSVQDRVREIMKQFAKQVLVVVHSAIESEWGKPLKTEVAEIQRLFGDMNVQVVEATSQAVGDCLLGENHFDVIHWVGHGRKDGRLASNRRGGAFDITALGDVLQVYRKRHGTIPLVFLNACYSFKTALSLRRSCKSVMCTPRRLLDSRACAFAQEFYRSLSGSWDPCWAYDTAQEACPVPLQLLGHRTLVTKDQVQCDRCNKWRFVNEPWCEDADFVCQDVDFTCKVTGKFWYPPLAMSISPFQISPLSHLPLPVFALRT
eukprot:COSAG01_NODE_12055_length_1806_cov_1.285714_1_plen_280_part_00